MIYFHYSWMPWDKKRWPNFQPREFACKHCGEAYYHPEAFDRIQQARTDAGIPFIINSAHRCWRHNARVGGAPKSAHKKIAFDVAVTHATKRTILEALRRAGFTTFGFYGTFIHTDPRPNRRWSTAAGRRTWSGLLAF